MAICPVRIEKITPFTKRFAGGKAFLSSIYLTKWTCRNVQRLRNNAASLSTISRCKPILDEGDGLHGTPASCALQGQAAPRPPHQPQISFPTAGVLWRESPRKCCRKSPENQTKLPQNSEILAAVPHTSTSVSFTLLHLKKEVLSSLRFVMSTLKSGPNELHAQLLVTTFVSA